MQRRRFGRRPLICILVVVCTLITGAAVGVGWVAWKSADCPYPHDARAYAQPRCSGGLFSSTSTTFTTLDQSLETFNLPLPEDAQGVRFYIDPGSFRSGYAFFMHFTASRPEAAAFLAKIGSTRGSTSAEAAWRDWSAEPVPWRFDASARYAVYDFTSTAGGGDIDQGIAIVDQGATEPAVYLYIWSF